MKRTGTWCAWVVAAVALAPVGLAAQTSEAVRLEADALSLSESPSDLGKAADLFREAAGLRSQGDPIAARDLVQSARYSFYAGRRDQALKDFASAAESALKHGDIVAAAESFPDAAWVAKQVQDGPRAVRYSARARELTSSPSLNELDRARLLARLPG
jgi:hypothetical protein